MAKSVNVQVVADVTQYERALRRAAQDTKKFDRAVSRTTSNAREGSQAFRSLGRSIAFASGGYLAFGGATELLRSTLDAAGAAETAQKQLATQLAASGIRFETVRGQIDRTTRSLSHLAGFTSDDLTKSLTTLVRATGDVNTALQLNAIAADVARGRGISLVSAATTLGKAYNGQTGALKRLGVTLPPTVKGMAALEAVARKYAGQAEAGKSATDDFNVSLNELQVEAGKGLIPVLDGVLKGLTGIVQGVEAVNRKLRSSGLGFLTHGLTDIRVPFLDDALDNLFGRGKGAGPPVAVLPPTGALGPTGVGKLGKLKDVPKGITADQRNQWFDAMINRQLGRVQDIPAIRDQISRLREIAALIQQRINATDDVTRRLNLEVQKDEVFREIRADQQQIADNAKAAAEAAAAAAAARKAAADAAAQAAREEALAWADFAIERAGATETLRDDLKAAQAKLELLKKQAGVGKKTAEQARQIWEAQQDVNEIAKKMRAGQDDAGFRHFTSAQIRAAIGGDASAAATRRLIGLFATLGPRGSVPRSTGQFALAGGTTINGDVHLHGPQNMRQLTNELAKHAKGRSHVRRGARG